jgi:lipopolysaccharide assembly protein A
MRFLVWLFRGLVFFTLFAFALNNQQDVVLHWFFGAQWRAPLVIVVLSAFAAGCALGVLAMVPAWWQHRRVATSGRLPGAAGSGAAAAPAAASASGELALPHPPREGL